MTRALLLAFAIAIAMPSAVRPALAAPAAGLPAEAPPQAIPNPAAEKDAIDAFRRGHSTALAGELARALSAFKDLPVVSAAGLRQMERHQRDAYLVGQALPEREYGALTWLRGRPRKRGDALVVFAEQWCPHCRREVPTLPAFAASNDLDLIVITRLNRGVSRDTLDAWLEESGVTGPVAHDVDGVLTKAIGGGPVPAALVVRDGIIVWRGHPARLTKSDPLTRLALDDSVLAVAKAQAGALAAAVARPWPASMPTGARPTPAAGPPAEETAALALLRSADVAAGELRWSDAQRDLDRLRDEYGTTRVWRTRGTRRTAEVGVVGKTVPAAPFSPLQHTLVWPPTRPTLVVFWESWCPHCRREMPNVATLAARYAGHVEVVGFTRLTRGSTRDQALEFLAATAPHLPNGVDPGSITDTFQVSGVPAAAVIRDGRIVWRGHPATLTDALMKRVLDANIDTVLDGITE